MQKIGVLSDTHLLRPTGMLSSIRHALRSAYSFEDVQTLLAEHFRDANLIIHTGDFVDVAVLTMLQQIAPVEAVSGNMDNATLRTMLPTKKTLQIGNFTLGIIHGDGGPQGIIERVSKHFTHVDAIVFGHTHHPVNERHDGILYFNPGSPTDRIFAPYNSIGMLEIDAEIRANIIRL